MTQFFIGGNDDADLSSEFATALAEKFPTDSSSPPGDDAGSGSPPGPVSQPVAPQSTDIPAEIAEDPAGTAPPLGGEGGPGDVSALPDTAPPVIDGLQIAEGDTGPAASPATAPAAPTPDDIDLNDLFTRWAGSKPTREQMVNLFNLVSTISALPSDRQALLNAVLQGQDLGQSPAPASVAAPPAPAVPSNQPSLPFQSAGLPDDLTPEARAILEPMAQRMAHLEESLQAQQQQAQIQQQQAAQAQAASYYQTAQAGASQASQTFVAEHPELTPNDLILLESRVAQSGHYPFYLQQNNGDHTAAYRSLLEAGAMADPTMAQRIVDARAQTVLQQQATDATRQRKAASVATGGTTRPAVTPAAPSSSKPSRQDMIRDAAREVAEALGVAAGSSPTPPARV